MQNGDFSVHHAWVRCVILIVASLCSVAVKAAVITIVDDIQTYAGLANETVNMSGVSELHLTNAANPISACTINLDSVDSWLFLENIKPSVAASTYLSQVKVNSANAVLNTNVRVVEYAAGAVIIPQASTFQPLQVFPDQNFQGTSAALSQYTAYNTSSLGTMANNISSFILKRGYTATFAQNANGTGYSKNYVAQDCDLQIGVLPTKLDNRINFVRIFPWRWTGKKGACDNSPLDLNPNWWYNWDINSNSSLDTEYVAIRQQPYWPGLDQNWQTRGINHLLGFNEPDNPVEDAYKNLSPPGSVDSAIWHWPPLLATGLRVGAPAVTDGGAWWIQDFMNKANAADIRIDYVPVHYYRCYGNNDYSQGAADQLYNYLKSIYDVVQRPIWVTEFNNGANWTGCADPSITQNRNVIEAMINMMDSVPWIERYAIYSRVEWFRQTHYDEGGLTPMGVMYRDHVAPIAYRQEAPGSGKSANALYSFDADFRDNSGNGNNPLIYGAPKRESGLNGSALVLDGTDDYLVLPTNMAENADFTFAAWVYWNGGGQWQRIFDFGNNTSQYLFVTPRSGDNTLRFAIKNGGTEQIVQTAQLAAAEWVHVAVTLADTTAKLYVNGTLMASNGSVTINPSDFTPAVNYIGDSQWSADPLFNGMLDDVMIADYALSAGQITTLFTDNQPARFIDAPLNIVGSTAGAEETGNPAVNSYDRNRATRWANDGTVANGWIRYDLGAVSEADRVKVRFNNGVSRTFPIRIDIDGTVVFNGNTSMTSGYWETAFTPAGGRYVTITMTGNNSDGSGWFSIRETQVWAPFNEPPAFNTNPVNGADAVEITAYSSTLADKASDPQGDPLTFSKDAGPGWLTVAPDGALWGTPNDSNIGENTFTVRVQDPRGLYDLAELTIQVANLYSGVHGTDDLLSLAAQWLMLDCGACDGADLDGDTDVTMTDFSILARNWLADEALQLHLKFDETSGDTARDSSIYWRAGSLIDGPVWDTGHFSGALSLDGVDDYVKIPGCKGITGTAARTCTAWIKTAQPTGEILTWGEDYPGGRWVIRLNEGGQLRAEVQGGNIIGTTLINDGSWHHIAVVLEDDGHPDITEARLYVDGSLETISASADEPVNTGSYQDVQIGMYYVGKRWFNGLIDDVRIYSTSFTDVQIQELNQ
jgi:hypothetical protein